MARRLHGRMAAVAGLLGYLLLTLALTYPLIRRFTDAIPGDGFDGWQNFWNLWWVRRAFLEQHTLPWFTDALYYPTGVSLLFHTLNAFNGITFLPVQLAWGLFPAYNCVVLFSFAVSGLGVYLLACYVLGPRSSRLAAFGAGIVFAFSPFHFAHLLGHMQVISLEWMPFFALYLLRTVDGTLGVGSWKPEASPPTAQDVRRRVFRNALLAVFFLVLAALCDWYQALYCLLFTAVVVIWAGVQIARGRTAVREQIPDVVLQPVGTHERSAGSGRRSAFGGPAIQLVAAAAGIWLLWAMVLSPLLLPMIQEARQFTYMVPDPEDSRRYSADLLAFITPQQFHPLWGKWAAAQASVFTSTVSENQVFAGFTVLALAALGVVVLRAGTRATRNRPLAAGRAFWLAVLAVFFVLALGPVLHIAGHTHLLPGGGEVPLPYAWLTHLPFVSISRSVSRFDALVMLALAILAGLGLNWLAHRCVSGRSAAAACVALVLFEFLPVPYPLSVADTPAWYTTLAADPRPGSVLNLPMNWDRPNYLLHQTTHGKPLVAGYISRDDPRTLVDLAPVFQHFRHLAPDIIAFDLAGQGQQVLYDLGVRWVVLDAYQMPPSPNSVTRQYTLATVAQIFGNQPSVYRDDRLTIYEVGAPTHRAPYLILGSGWGVFDPESAIRTFNGSARIVVRSPDGGGGNLCVTLAPGSPPLDAAGSGGQFTIPVTLHPGDNQVVLRSRQPGQRVEVKQLALIP